MKRIYFVAVALVASMLLTTSCSNDDIVVETTNPRHGLTLNINTQKMYDDFGNTTSIRETFLRDKVRCVGVKTYIYDSDGNLVANQESHLENFNVATQTFEKLVEGNYSIVIVETLLNPDVDYTSEVWSIEDIEKISTLKIKQKRSEPDENGHRWPIMAYEGNVVGVYSGNVSVGSNQVIEATPAAVGSVIKFNQYNFENSPFETAGYSTNDVLDYYSLDPSLDRGSKYKTDLTSSGYANVRDMNEADDDPTKYFGSYVLESGVDWYPVAQTQEGRNNGKVTTWGFMHNDLEDGKTYYLGFYYLWSKNNSAVASYGIFDTLEDLYKWKLDNDDSVERHKSGNLFAAPYTSWSVGTVSAVKAYMDGFYLHQDITFNSALQNYDMVYFDQANNNIQYHYFFTSSTRGLTDAIVYLEESDFSIEGVREEIIKQGYTYMGEVDSYFSYEKSSTKTGVSVQAYSGLIIVDYYSLEAYNAAPMREIPLHNIGLKTQEKSRNRLTSLVNTNDNLAISPYIRIKNQQVLIVKK